MKRTLPFFTPRARVQAQEWISLQGPGAPLRTSTPAWDYNGHIELFRSMVIDLPGILKDCHLESPTEVALCVRWWTTAARIRTLGAHTVLNSSDPNQQLRVSIDGSMLGGALVLETSIELLHNGRSSRPFVARHAGTILWRDTARRSLEGDSGLLPIAPISFTEHPRLPQTAAWYVSLDFADWNAPVMGCLLVLLNTDHDRIAKALAPTDDQDASHVLWGALEVDIVADVIGKATDDETFSFDASWSSDDEALSIGGFVTGLIRGFLRKPAESDIEAFKRLRELRRDDPSMFRAEVQHAVHFLKDEQ